MDNFDFDAMNDEDLNPESYQDQDRYGMVTPDRMKHKSKRANRREQEKKYRKEY